MLAKTIGRKCLTTDLVIKGTILMAFQNIYRQSPLASFSKFSIPVIILFISIISSPFARIAHAEETVYTIQLGYYLDDNKAKEKIESLKALGHNAFLVNSDTADNGKVSIVYIEKFNTKQEAEDEARVLKELKLITEYSIQSIKGTVSPAPGSTPETTPDTQPALKKKVLPAPPSAPKVTEKKMEDGYYLQVSAAKEEESARTEVDGIKKTGREAFYRYETVKDTGSWYKVYVGGYASKSEAMKDGLEMKKSGLISAYYLKRLGKITGTPKPQVQVKNDAADEKIYYLHVSSYTEQANAETDVNRLKDLGLKAFFVKEDVSGVSWYRTYIGEFGDEETAKKTGSELQEKGDILYFKAIEIDKSLLE
jgi:cell division septation protein DedD